MFNKPSLNFLLVLAILVLFSSCWTTSKFVERGRYNTSKIPQGYDPSKHVLLFVEMPRLNAPDQTNKKITEKMNEELKKYFPYKYEIVSMDDVRNMNSKYSDTSVYRYAVFNNLNSTTTTTTTTFNTGGTRSRVSPSARTTYLSFSFYDRSNKLDYGDAGNAFPKLEYVVAAFSELVKRAKN